MKRYSNRYKKRQGAFRVWMVILPVAVCAAVLICLLGGRVSLKAGAAHVSQTAVSSSGDLSAKKTESSSSAASLTGAALAKASLPAVQVSLADAVKPLWVDVRLSTQDVVVYDAKNRVVESFICSSGAVGDDTPTGTYTVSSWGSYPERGKSFYSAEYQEGAYYYVRFNHHYLFHSVPYDQNGKIIQTQVNDLGTPSSHGCIHLTIANAKWIYDNIPGGTKVVVE